MASQLIQPLVELCTVMDVDVRNYTVRLTSENANKGLDWIPFASPYCHNAEGEGLTVVPEVGSQAVLITPSDDSPPFVACFLMYVEGEKEGDEESKGHYRGGRPIPQPGDIMATTRDGNFLFIRRGGIVQIGSTPVAQRLYIPLDNLIRDICQNYRMETMGGTLDWTVQHEDLDDPDALFTLMANELATDVINDPALGTTGHSIVVKIGKAFGQGPVGGPATEKGTPEKRHPHGFNEIREGAQGAGPGLHQLPPTNLTDLVPGVGYIEVEINPLGAGRTTIFRLDKNGNSFHRQEGSRDEEIAKSHFVRVEEDFTHQVGRGYSLAVGDTEVVPQLPAPPGNLSEFVQFSTTRVTGVQWYTPPVDPLLGTSIDVCQFRVVAADNLILLGSGDSFEPAVLGWRLIDWLATHRHGHPSCPPPLPTQVVQLPAVLSDKVYLEKVSPGNQEAAII